MYVVSERRRDPSPERRPHGLLALIAVVVTSATLFAAVSVDRLAAATPQRESAKPCKPAEVASLVVRFIDAFNAGNLERLDRVFARKPDFRWYSTDAPAQRFLSVAADRASLIRYFNSRHARGEHLQLRSLRVNGNTVAPTLKPYGNFQYRLVRSAGDLPPTNYQGKGALQCYASRGDQIIVWSMARES